jgi:hypothetical protein
MTDYSGERVDALAYAVELRKHDIEPSIQRVLRDANGMFRWLTAPIRLVLTAGPALDQTTGNPSGNEGGTTMVAIKDTEKFELTVTAEDAKGQVTAPPTDVTYTPADTTVISITGPDADGKTWGVGGVPGSTVITADWPDSPSGDLQGTLAVDVSAGDATSLVIAAGDPVPQ